MRRNVIVLSAALVFAVAGCGGDVAQQLAGNQQFRTQVLDAIATHRDLAFQTIDRLMASDSLRVPVVDKVLQNDEGARIVLARTATNPNAVDLVLATAMRDSVMRMHVITIVEGMTKAHLKK